MPDNLNRRRRGILAGAGFTVIAVAAIVLLLLREAQTGANDASQLWTSAQIAQPADFAKELTDWKNASEPIVVCVGFQALYRSAHIPGAVFHGPAGTTQGLDDLKKWARDISRSKTVVIYCGCCPLSRCPNVRPAFAAMKELGFPTHLKVLSIPTDFQTDWTAKGYRVEAGK